MPPGSADSKPAWRAALAGVFALIPSGARQALDAALAERLDGWLAAGRFRVVFGFAPLPDEPGLLPLFRRWLAGGGVLGFPVWLGGGDMLFRRVGDLEKDLRLGRAGILEPPPSLPEIRPSEAEAVITPGRAFSETLTRLGRGAGCYDRLFRRAGAVRAGVAYDFQIFPELPSGGEDLPVDLVFTPSRGLRRA
jgi:5-formyltetrahydrofolate cyclo-ligase